jgi:Uncharacterized protein conserved in bacteria
MKKFITALTILAMSLIASTGVAVAAYPEKPVNMIIAFTAGGSSDVQARIMQKYWDKHSNQQWAFVYKPGAGGAIGFGEVAMARKDGYTIGGVNVPHVVLQPLMQKAQFSVDSFEYICQVVNDPQTITVRKDSRFNSVKEVLDFAKANPGKLKVGLVGPNSGHHLMFIDMQKKFGFPVTEVFYKGAADQNAAVLGGEVEVILGNLNDVMRSLDEMKILGLAAAQRNDFLPEVPTLRELGVDVLSDIRRGYIAPKGIKAEQLAYLRDVFKKIAEDPQYIADMKTAGQPTEYATGEDFEKFCKAERERITALFKEAGIIK